MPSWFNIGTLTPTYDHNYFDIALVGSSLLRVRQTYDVKPIGYAWLYQVFYNKTEFATFRKLYPSKDSRMIEMLVHPALENAGEGVFHLGLRLSVRARPFLTSNWSVSVDLFNP